MVDLFEQAGKQPQSEEVNFRNAVAGHLRTLSEITSLAEEALQHDMSNVLGQDCILFVFSN